jgi:hypothetical protein
MYLYKSLRYRPDEDHEPDCKKIWHTVIDTNTGIEIGWIPFSPYSYVSEEAFKAWVDSRYPSREEINRAVRGGNNVSNPSNEDIINYYIEKVLLK